VKEIFVQFPTYEVAQALDEDLSIRLGSAFSSKDEQQRLVGILLALKELGSVSSHEQGHETWFYLDAEENQASDVIRIRLNGLSMSASNKLSKRILSALKETGRIAAELDAHHANPQKYKIELDPFISQLARWVDKEVTAQRSEFKAIERTERLAQICIQLQQHGVAARSGTEFYSLWTTAAAIDRRIGGVKVSHNSQFSFVRSVNAMLLYRFDRAVKEHLKHRLTDMRETEESFFSLCNEGAIRIAHMDSDGHYFWEAADEALLKAALE
jgi:hypothetical protein